MSKQFKSARVNVRSHPHRVAILSVVTLLAMSSAMPILADAIYRSVDAQGRAVFSDNRIAGSSSTKVVRLSYYGSKRGQRRVPEYRASLLLEDSQSDVFSTPGQINSVPVTFIVDTGASVVLINRHLAEQLEIIIGPDQFSTPANTPIGVGHMALVQVDSITVGELKIPDVEVGVVNGDFPKVALLGMSFLSRVDIVKRGSRLTLIGPSRSE